MKHQLITIASIVMASRAACDGGVRGQAQEVTADNGHTAETEVVGSSRSASSGPAPSAICGACPFASACARCPIGLVTLGDDSREGA